MCLSIVVSNMIFTCRWDQTDKTYQPETANEVTIPILGSHLVEFKIGKQKVVNAVRIADILDDVIFGLDVMERVGFRLNLKKKFKN